jgi:23S rRNA (pseudouridine1915-N3)-methyltransferase
LGRIVVRSLGPVRGAWRELAERYLERLQGRLPLHWEERAEVRADPRLGPRDEERVKRSEAERLLQGLPQDAALWALDPLGEELDSPAFARLVQAWQQASVPQALLVGGHLGLDGDLRRRSRLLSLSRLTFSHQMVPAVLFEQIYRAVSILDGTPYHR